MRYILKTINGHKQMRLLMKSFQEIYLQFISLTIINVVILQFHTSKLRTIVNKPLKKFKVFLVNFEIRKIGLTHTRINFVLFVNTHFQLRDHFVWVGNELNSDKNTNQKDQYQVESHLHFGAFLFFHHLLYLNLTIQLLDNN